MRNQDGNNTVLEELQDSAGTQSGRLIQIYRISPSAGSTVISADLRDAEYQDEEKQEKWLREKMECWVYDETLKEQMR